jgi:hypothetical protein
MYGYGLSLSAPRYQQLRAALAQAAQVAPVMLAALPLALSIPQPIAPPTQPLGGLLQRWTQLLATGFMPAMAAAPAVDSGLAATALLLVALGLLLTVAWRRLDYLASDFAERLRQSGFVGAPRSDAMARLSFATPLQWVVLGRVMT